MTLRYGTCQWLLMCVRQSFRADTDGLLPSLCHLLTPNQSDLSRVVARDTNPKRQRGRQINPSLAHRVSMGYLIIPVQGVAQGRSRQAGKPDLRGQPCIIARLPALRSAHGSHT